MRLVLVIARVHVVLVLRRRAFALASHAVATTAAAAATASSPLAFALLFTALGGESLLHVRRAVIARALLGTIGAEFLFRLARLIGTMSFRRMLVVTMVVLTMRLCVSFAAVAPAPSATAPPTTTAFGVLLGGGLCWRFALAFLV